MARHAKLMYKMAKLALTRREKLQNGALRKCWSDSVALPESI